MRSSERRKKHTDTKPNNTDEMSASGDKAKSSHNNNQREKLRSSERRKNHADTKPKNTDETSASGEKTKRPNKRKLKENSGGSAEKLPKTEQLLNETKPDSTKSNEMSSSGVKKSLQDEKKKCIQTVEAVGTNDNMTASSLPNNRRRRHQFKKSQDDTLSESMINVYSEQMQSVGILTAPSGKGTVFRVGSKYLMTAFHVVEDLVGKVMDDSVYITFNESVLDHRDNDFHIEKIIFFDRDLDVAVLELAKSNRSLPPKLQLSNGDDARNAEDVSFIGYGHPEFKTKRLDPRCKLISPDSQRFKDAHEWLDKNATFLKVALLEINQDPDILNQGYGDYADDRKLIFDCFMQQGASGSPALTCINNGRVKVVGVLTHGLPIFYFYMSKIKQRRVDDKFRFEVACKTGSIYNNILKENKDLAKDLFE